MTMVKITANQMTSVGMTEIIMRAHARAWNQALGDSHFFQRWCREQPVWFIPPTRRRQKFCHPLVRRSSAKPDGSRRCTITAAIGVIRPIAGAEPGRARMYCRQMALSIKTLSDFTPAAFRPPGVGLGGYGHLQRNADFVPQCLRQQDALLLSANELPNTNSRVVTPSLTISAMKAVAQRPTDTSNNVIPRPFFHSQDI
jgi:hypothetical protein